MSEAIKQGAEHIDRPVPDGITNVSVFAPPNGTMGPWAFCDVSGVDWSTDRDGNWDFEWGYDEHRTRIGLEREQVEFLAYLTGLVDPAAALAASKEEGK